MNIYVFLVSNIVCQDFNMLLNAFLIFLPIFATAEIQIDILVSDTLHNTEVHMSGASDELISDIDQSIFRLRDSEVKNTVHKFSGGRPDGIYLKDPTPWGNLFQNYGWNETKRRIIPVTMNIRGLHIETVVVDKSKFQTDMRVRHTWIAGKTYYFGDYVSYSVSLGSNIGKNRSVYYKNWLGFGHSTSSGVSVGSSISATQSEDTARSVLTAKRGVLKLEIVYEAKLRGGIVCNFENKFKGHHFWYYGVNNVLNAERKRQRFVMKEVIEVVFYFNEEVTLS